MWNCKTNMDKLEITHERASQVKESRIDRPMHQFEISKMQKHENINEMMTWFTHIINPLKYLGKAFFDVELVIKHLGVCKTYESKK